MPETIAVRPGEELNADSLADYLSGRIGIAHHEISIDQFPGGSSNLTYLLRLGDEEFVLRRPPFGNTVRSAHDMKREYSVLAKLSRVYPPAPRPILFCDDEAVIGSEFYLMERRRGMVLRAESPAELGRSTDLQRQVCRCFIDNLARLHSLDFESAGLGGIGRPEGYARRQVEGWTKRYFDAKTDEHLELENAIEWLNQNIPTESGASLVHNDYKFDNVMLDPDDPTQIVAVLDWEMVTIGDPLMDLGTTLGYWIGREGGEEMLNMPFNPRVLRENVSRRELVAMYADSSGRDVSNILYYYVFGLFKIAVIAQQIYLRYVKEFTRDERFARLDRIVHGIGLIAARSISCEQI